MPERTAEEMKAIVEKRRERRREWADQNGWFIDNVIEARKDKNPLICAECGRPLDEGDFGDEDAHDVGCKNEGRDLLQEDLDFLKEVLGEEKFTKVMADTLAQVEEEKP